MAIKQIPLATQEEITEINSRLTQISETKADKTSLANANRQISALWALNEGKTYRFEEDDAEAYTKDIPSGAVMASIGKLGAKSIVVEGELVTAECENVKVVGKNLVYEKWENTSIDSTGIYVKNAEYDTYVAEIVNGERYTVSANVAVFGFHTEKPTIASKTYDGIRHTELATGFIAPISGYITFRTTKVENAVMWHGSVKPTLNDYTPYTETNIPTASIIHKYFPNGMKSAGGVCDEIDLERGVAVQRVVELTSDNFIKFNSSNGFDAYRTNVALKLSTDIQQTNSFSLEKVPSFISSAIEKECYQRTTNNTAGILYFAVSQTRNINDLVFCVELATPTETPLDESDIEALTALYAEGNGTITFENGLDGLHIPIPNKVEYTVKLSEVV